MNSKHAHTLANIFLKNSVLLGTLPSNQETRVQLLKIAQKLLQLHSKHTKHIYVLVLNFGFAKAHNVFSLTNESDNCTITIFGAGRVLSR